jgi:hypothetical protein
LKIANFSAKRRIFQPTIAISADEAGGFLHIMSMKIAPPYSSLA